MKYKRTLELVNNFSFFLFFFHRGGWIAFPLADFSIRKWSNGNNSADKRKLIDNLIAWRIDSLPDSSGLTLTLLKSAL